MFTNLTNVFIEGRDKLRYNLALPSFMFAFANAKVADIIKILVVFMISFLCFYSASGANSLGYDDFEVDGIRYRLFYSNGTSDKRLWNTCDVCGLSDKNLKKIIIPNEVEFKGISYPVKSIGRSVGYNGFNDEVGIERVVLGDNVYNINCGFGGCINLKEIDFGNAKIEKIRSFAFYNCSSLKEIRIPEGAALEAFVFSGCSSLESVQLPSNMQSLPNGLFKDCKSLKSINIPKSVTEISNNVFVICI